ncbi:helix-turn-helix domain-containing protein [Streptomonospora sp. PA3]|uniref:helix-turn-helix transcriptional regulator n=1 Tax=Streptomonospora sp. PA3 TaxID=2607326 RepID=UPI0012DF2E3B|nr:helix-turn-helix domain-containing protein [Streptomonospora sp. PA3]MUL40363.1 helix-turn-helix domain-containing protein [Streptomonospora sp. PA3]
MTGSGIDALGVLAEPLRRRLYDYVAGHGGEVSRAEAAEAVGARRNLAAFHLDKLVEAGLLEVSRRKVSGREGPGSGRPAKVYRRSGREHAVHLPPRDYGGAAALLAEAVERAGAEEALYAAAREEGERRGAARAGTAATEADLARVLERYGYEPAPVPPGDRAARSAGCPDAADPPAHRPMPAAACPVLRLRNCPFDAVARSHPPVACGMNLELLRGLLRGAGADSFRADMAPAVEGCCVLISAVAPDSKTNSD